MIGKIISGAIKGARASWSTGTTEWQPGFGGSASISLKSKAGPTVTPSSVMQLSAAYACTARTSQLIGSLPSGLFEKGSNDSRDRIDTELASILTISPNSEQTAAEFWEGFAAQICLKGNAIAERLFVGDRLVGLKPLPSGTVARNRAGELEFSYVDRGRSYKLPRQKIFHVPGFGIGDGIGLSPVRYGVQSLGAALAADEVAASIFSNGMSPGGLLESDQTLTPEQRAQLNTLLETFVGSSRAGKTLIMEAGLKYKQLTLNPEDAQLLETRRFSIEDICRWFGTPPIIIGHAAEGQTMWGTGVEAIMLSWLTTGINPILRKIEARVRKDLVSPSARRRTYFEFNREAMLQMDSGAKGEFLSKMASSATLTANERRAMLNKPRSDDPNADKLLAQGAMVTLSNLGGQNE